MKTIKELAREAQLIGSQNAAGRPCAAFEFLQVFAALVRAEVLEEAARICDHVRREQGALAERERHSDGTANFARLGCAGGADICANDIRKAIRALAVPAKETP